MTDFTRKNVPQDHPLKRSFTEIDQRRVEKEIDDIFAIDESPLEEDDIEIGSSGSHGVSIEPSGYLGDEKFEAFTEQARESEALGYNRMDKTNYLKRDEALDTPRPFAVHTDRSTEAAQQDTRRKARVTTDPEKYASDPDSYDYPFVDTPSEFKDKYDSTNWNKFERMAGEDDVFEY